MFQAKLRTVNLEFNSYLCDDYLKPEFSDFDDRMITLTFYSPPNPRINCMFPSLLHHYQDQLQIPIQTSIEITFEIVIQMAGKHASSVLHVTG